MSQLPMNKDRLEQDRQEQIRLTAKDLLDNIDPAIVGNDHGKMTLEYTALIMRCKLDVSDSRNWQYFNTFKSEWQFIFNGLPRKIPTVDIPIHDYDHYSRIPDKGFLNNYNECLYNSRNGFIRVRTIHPIGQQMVFVRTVPDGDEDETSFYLVPVSSLRIFHKEWFAKYKHLKEPTKALPTHYRGNITLYKPLWFWDLRLAATDEDILRPAYKIPDAANKDCPCNITQTIRNNIDLDALADDTTVIIWVHCGKLAHIKTCRICSSDIDIEFAGTMVSFDDNKMIFNKDDSKYNELNDGNVNKNKVRVMDHVVNNSWMSEFTNLSMNWIDKSENNKADDMNTSMSSGISGIGQPLGAHKHASNKYVPNTPHIQPPQQTLNRNPNRISKLQMNTSRYDPTPYKQRISKMTMAATNRMARTLRTYPSRIGNGFMHTLKTNDAQNNQLRGYELTDNSIDNNASFIPHLNEIITQIMVDQIHINKHHYNHNNHMNNHLQCNQTHNQINDNTHHQLTLDNERIMHTIIVQNSILKNT
eukprot:806177_1